MRSIRAILLIDSLKKVEKETEQLKKPISTLSDLTLKILRYNAIQVTEKLVIGGKNNDFDFGEDKDEIAITEIRNVISADKLSSGEKQMLGFLCYNAFYDNTPIFIDEPELSLHVDWQRRLFSTLLEQGQKINFL